VIRLVVAEDHPAVRMSLVTFLDAQDDIDVIGEAGDGAEAVELAGRLEPDAVLMDVRMPRLDGIEATRRITRARPEVTVLLVSAYEEDELRESGTRAGAAGYVLKGASGAELVERLREVVA
jgi:DNA-binding NarL/FixJ family response regulator